MQVGDYQSIDACISFRIPIERFVRWIWLSILILYSSLGFLINRFQNLKLLSQHLAIGKSSNGHRRYDTRSSIYQRLRSFVYIMIIQCFDLFKWTPCDAYMVSSPHLDFDSGALLCMRRLWAWFDSWRSGVFKTTKTVHFQSCNK